MRANELLRELYWEALRAPNTYQNLRRNPYLRDRMKKKIGATRSERLKFYKEGKRELKQFKIKRELELQE